MEKNKIKFIGQKSSHMQAMDLRLPAFTIWSFLCREAQLVTNVIFAL